MRLLPSFSLLLLSITAAGLVGSAAACSGAVESAPATDAGTDTGPTTPRRDAGGEEPDADPPLRDVTTPVAIDLGKVAYGQEVAFTVPPNALGFNVVVESLVAGAEILGVERITSPNGEIVHDAFTPKGGDHETSTADWGSIASASVPQNELAVANPPMPGTWKVRFGTTANPPPPPPLDAGLDDGGAGEGGITGPASMKATVKVQIGSPSGFAGGRLDLRVYIPKGLKLDGAILDSENAKTNAAIAKRVDTFFSALGMHVGIDRGEVTFHPAANSLSFIDDFTLLTDGFAVSRGRPDGEQALHLLLTNGIDFGEAGAAWGIAPGIPGAHTRTGTSMSGIILAVDDTPAVGDGLTILHEAGHFFGLNHTTELGGGFGDPLSDTPRCEKISIDDPLSLKACPDKANVMFPTFYGTAGAAVIVSDAQKRVYRGSPIYKAYKTPVAGTMAQRPSTGPLRPLEAFTLTKSGRALTPVESWLAGGLCGHTSHAKLDPSAIVRARGRDAAIAELTKAANDQDLPAVMRRKATAALNAIPR
ncbi:MAG: hypothetical protein JST00_34475 [Deltaproteobacteria bacterium]|nr:hypothetical protein [Deltaproteobacteria bacterium]